MKGDRFKTEQSYFETDSPENESPFNLHYQTNHQMARSESAIGTEQSYFETDSPENESPFNLHYQTNHQMARSESAIGTEQSYFETDSPENESPFNLHYIKNESPEISSLDKPDFEEKSSEIGTAGAYEDYLTDYVKYIYGYKEIPSKSDFYKAENLLKARDFEIFSNEIHDSEFKTVLAEIANDTEYKFQSFMNEKGDNRYFENLLADTNFERNFGEFFETEYRPLISGVENEFDRLSNYVEQSSHVGMNYENIQSIIDSFEVEPEHFFGSFGKAIRGIVNKGKKAIGGAIKLAKNVASKVGKTLLLGPFLRIITAKLKNSITPVLKSILEKVKGKLPEQYRGLAQKALDALNPMGNQASAQGVGSSEGTGDLDAANTSAEIYELYEAGSEHEDEMTEIEEVERELDKQIYMLAHNIERANEELDKPEAVINEQFLDNEWTEGMSSEIQLSEFTMLDRSRSEFVSGIANNTMETRELVQNFVPFILPAIKGALKLTGGRQKIVDLISSMAADVLGNIIGKDQAGPLSRILVDQGLKLFGLEIPESKPNEYLGATISNIITETTDKVSQLPESVLNGDEKTLRPFVKEALFSSIANNVPSSTLNESTKTLRQLPDDMGWVSEKNGYYQRLNKEMQFVLKPEDAAKIYTRRAETLLDILCKYQGWDGKTPVPVVAYVFQSNPLTRLAMIARDYAGGDSSDKKRQIIRLNSDAATMLFKEPSLAGTTGTRSRSSRPRWYYVKLANLDKDQTSQSITQTATTNVNDKIRANELDLRFIQGPNFAYELKVKIFLNEATSDRIKSMVKSVQPTTLYRELETILMKVGKEMISNLLTRLVIPQYAKNEIMSIVFTWILNNIRSKLSPLTDEYITQSAKDDFGATIQINVPLPGDFMTNLNKLTLANVGSFISSLTAIRPDANVNSISGYKI